MRNTKDVSVSTATDSSSRQPSESESTAPGEILTNTTISRTSTSDSVTFEPLKTDTSREIQTSASTSKASTNGSMNFEPAKTSSKVSLNGAKSKKSTTTSKQISNTNRKRVTSTANRTRTKQMYNLESGSDSEDDPDGVLKQLLGGAVSRLQSLQAKVKVAGTVPAEPVKERPTQQKRGRKESKVVTDEEKLASSKSNRRTIKKPQRNSQARPSPVKPPRSSIAGAESDIQDLQNGAVNDLLSGTVDGSLHRAEVVDDQSPNVKRKSILKVKNVSVVLTKHGSPSSSGSLSSPASSSSERNQSKNSRVKKPAVKKTKKSVRVKNNVVRSPVSSSSTASSSGPSLSKARRLESIVKQTSTNARRRKRDTSALVSTTANETYAKKRTREEADDDSFPDPADLPVYEEEATHVSGQIERSSSVDVSVLPKVRKRKKMIRCVVPTKRRKTGPSLSKQGEKHSQSETAKTDAHAHPESTFDSEYEYEDVTNSPGGRPYRRLKLTNDVAKTPGVRRSHRTRIAPVKSWLNEKVDYNMKRRSGEFEYVGNLMLGLLVSLPYTCVSNRP